MQKNVDVQNENDDTLDAGRAGRLRKLLDYEVKTENGKIVLENRRIKMVQLGNSSEDREFYKTVTSDYIDFLRNHRGLEIREDVDYEELFKREVLHDNYEKVPLFAVYKRNGTMIGTCGCRYCIEVKKGEEKLFFYEISDRILQRHLSFGFGAIGAFIASNFFLNQLNERHLFFTSYPDRRDYSFRIIKACNADFSHYIGSKERYIDNIFGNIGKQDFFCTTNFDGLIDQLN